MASAIPYESRGLIAKPTGAAVVLALPFPSRSFIYKLMVRQKSGSGDFTVDAFNFNPANFSADNPEELFRVAPVQSGTAGILNYFPATAAPFFNHDGVDVHGRNPSTLYLRVNGAATGTFLMVVGALMPLT